MIEMVVYIALLTLVMGGTLAATYQLLSGQGRASGHNTTEEEGSFVLGKFAWGMGQITTPITSPTAVSTHPAPLDITTASGRVQMCFAGSTIWIREGAGACGASATPLTTSNVQVTGLDFTYIPAVGTGPDGITVSATINGETFKMTRYLRK